MSKEWPKGRIEYVRHSQPSQREWHEALDEIGLLQARVAELEAAAPKERRSCPCLHTTPCSPRCTCANSTSSKGCHRCCTYGSPSQQKTRAEYLAGLESAAPKPGDVVIPAVVAGRVSGCWSQFALATDGVKTDGETDFCARIVSTKADEVAGFGATKQDAINALAAALGILEASE